MNKIKIINLYVEELQDFINQVEKELILKNISYCLIKDSSHSAELHYQDKIYRLVDLEIAKETLAFFLENNNFVIKGSFSSMEDMKNNQMEIVDLKSYRINTKVDIKLPEECKQKIRREKPGYKKYTKNNIKQDNKKVNNKGYTKRFTYGK